MMRSLVLLPTAFVLLWPVSGSARNDDYDRNGVTLGLAGTYAVETFGNELEDDFQAGVGIPASVSVRNSLGVNANIGYRFHRFASAEVEAEWLKGIRSHFSVAGSRIARGDIEPWVITANAKGYPLTGRYQPFALVGVGVMTARVKVKDTVGMGESYSAQFTDLAMRFGAGFDFYLDDTFALTVGADYVLPFGRAKGLDYISIKWGVEVRVP